MSKQKKITEYIPVTPGGTPCIWLSAATEDQAWANLMSDAAHIPYQGKAGFRRRGYTVERWENTEQQEKQQ